MAPPTAVPTSLPTIPPTAARRAPVDPHLDLEAEIRRLKRERNAVILAHYYQDGEIQDLADFVGDSLGLSQQAAKTQADVIAFCGVHFMAETAKILNPTKTVVLPDLDAGCSLADRCPPDAFAAWLAQYPGHEVVSYINCSAAVKALSTIICTSSNAVRVVSSLPKDKPIVFAPDRHLGRWVEQQTGRAMVLWPGFCVVHEQFTARRLLQERAKHPDAEIIAHPECEASVLALADFIGSTTALLDHVTKSRKRAFIVATEMGILHSMRKARPDATLIGAPPDSGCSCAACPYMRLNTLEKLYVALRDLEPRIELPEDVRRRALAPLQRMLALGKHDREARRPPGDPSPRLAARPCAATAGRHRTTAHDRSRPEPTTMRKLTPLILLVALLAAGFLAWKQGWFVGGGAEGGDGVSAADAPTGVPGATDLAAGGRRAADPEKDPPSYEGDPVGRVDLGRGKASLKGRVVNAEGPVRFARVSLVLPPPATAAVRTRKDGTFEVAGLPAGDLDLRVGAPEHVSRTVTVPGLVDGVEKDVGDVLLARRPPMNDGLSVKVIDEAGRPIAGAKVKASTLPWGLLVTMGARAGMPDVISHEATTDDLGFARIVPMAPERYDVVARAPDYTLDGVGNVVVAAGRVERVTIALKRALTIEGTVVDADKAPVAGAYVSCLAIPTFRSYELVETDASGHFTLTGLAAGTYMILGGRDDRGEGMTPNVKAGDRAARIQLGGAGAIRGRVLEADGKPAQKFSVRPYTGDWFRYNYSRQFAFADPEGRFVLPIAPGAYSLDVRSESGSFTTSKAVTVVKGENAETEIKLPAAGVVTGVVTDPDGAHLSGAEVFVKRGGFPPEPVREQYARADADGRFTVKGLAIEQVKLHVRHAGFATTEFATTAAPADQAKEVTIRMGRGARVLGHVQTKDGRPLEGTQVNLAQGFDFFSAKTAFTDATGAFVFAAVAAGKYQLSTGRFENGASGQRKEANVPAEGDVVVDFLAQDDSATTGTVTGKVSVAGRPVAKASVNAVDDRGGDAGASTETAADGTFTLTGLRPGRVQVWVQTADGLTDSETVTVSDGGGAAAVKFDFGSATIRATLVGADGKTLVTGAWVVVEKAEKREGGSGWEGVKAQVNSDEHGVVTASGLDPATYRLRIVGSGYAAKVTDPFPVGDGETRDLGTVRLSAGGGVTGKVTDGGGAPLEGIGVSVRNERGESVFLFNIASTGSNGRYELQGIEFGTYRLRFEGKGFAPVEQDVTVTAQGAVADAVMLRGGELVARVEDERGQPVADARIVLYDGTGKRLERTLSIVNLFEADATRTKASGTATIPDLAPGRYRATVEKDGAVAVGDPIAFTVEAGGRASVTLVLKPVP